ncbi:MAG: ArnT family glycosyltransferase [Gammaproteobacteria bacterium]
MYSLLSVNRWIFIIWLVLVSCALYFRPLLPVDETRYAAVAWEMWLRGDFLVPHLNGELYSQKPPLLFWLMQFSWRVFGVNDWSLRLVSPLFALGTVYLAAGIARLVWPERRAVADLVPIMLLGSGFWIVFSTLTMFDMMLTFFVTLAIYSVLKLAHAGLSLPRWLLLGAAIGGGVMSKGPVILLHVLPVAVAAPWWTAEPRPGSYWKRWYGGLFCSLVLGAAMALCWAIPAGIAGGEVYRNAIFWGQTQGRLVESFAHRLPWWWYLQYLPLLLLPWLLLKPFWLGWKNLSLQDAGLRFCAAWGMPLFIAFSLISGKRVHYLLPMFPLFILLLARVAEHVNGSQYDWRRTGQGLLAVLALIGAVMALAPWISGMTFRNADLMRLSPQWGVFLVFVTALLWKYEPSSAQESVFRVSMATVIALLVISSAFFSVRGEHYDTRQTGEKIAELFDQNREVAYLGAVYHGEYMFGGRLTKPIKRFHSLEDLERWMPQHPEAYLLMRYRKESALPARFPYYRHRYKNSYVALVPVHEVLNNPELKKILVK